MTAAIQNATKTSGAAMLAVREPLALWHASGKAFRMGESNGCGLGRAQLILCNGCVGAAQASAALAIVHIAQRVRSVAWLALS